MRRLGLAIWLALSALACSAGTTAAPTVTTDARNRTVTPAMLTLPVHVGGRVKTERLRGRVPKGAKSYVHQWPGVYFEAAFQGTEVVLKFDDASNEYRLLIDDLAPIALAQPGRVEVGVRGLAPGAHRLRLEKLTESGDRVGAFGGFYVPSDGAALPVAARARQIEFIGDSSMTGYGNRSATRQCTPDEVRLRTDTQRAFPALVAKHYDADYQVNAISGRGLVRNYDGHLPDLPLPRVYPLTLMHERAIYADPSWRPRLVVIKLSADFSTRVKPGEKWKSEEELAEAFVAGFADLIAEQHRRSPSAAILVLWFETGPGARADSAQRIAAAAREAGVGAIAFTPYTDPGYESSACDFHLSLADHRKVAAWMTGYLDAHPELWPKRSGGAGEQPKR